MRKRNFRYVVYALPLLLSGCSLGDVIGDWLAWVLEFLYSGYADLACKIKLYFSEVLLWFIQGIVTVAVSVISVFPEYPLPQVNLSQVTFLNYAAYFLPLSEIATLLIYLLEFTLFFMAVRTLLRWLKVLK